MKRIVVAGFIGFLVCISATLAMAGDRNDGGTNSPSPRSEAGDEVRNTSAEDITSELQKPEKGRAETSATSPIPLIHCTDIFHALADPDDHWDLATVYALMNQGKVDLRGIVFDYFHPHVLEMLPYVGDPAVASVAQMNYLTGTAVPAAMGSSQRLKSTTDSQRDAPIRDRAGVNLILKILRESSDPVAISVVGSSIDVALAANTDPDLFREKCRVVYMLAGTSHPEKDAIIEHNSALDRTAFRSCFSLPCPLYWCPSFHTIPARSDWYLRLKVQEYGCFWRFTQRDVLPFLSQPVQNYFIYGLTHQKGTKWLRYLEGEVDGDLLDKIGGHVRYMWTTAPLLHLAGLAVSEDGGVVPLEEAGERAVAGFEPVSVRTNESGVAEWEIDESSQDRFLFKVKNVDRYSSAMTEALKATLQSLD